MTDAVNHPAHYTQHPSGIECIKITEGMNAPNLANAFKYLFRAGLKGDVSVTHKQDLAKAAWYVRREISRLRANKPSPVGLFLDKEIDPVFHHLLEADMTEDGNIGELSTVLYLIADKLDAMGADDVG